MHTKPTPMLNFFVKSKTKFKPSKTMKYLFLLLHVIFALDFGFIKFKSSRIQILAKLMCFVQSSTAFIILTYVMYGHQYAPWLILRAVMYFSYTFSLLVAKNTLHDYQTDLHSFDAEIGKRTYCKVENKILFWIALTIVHRVLHSVVYCSYFFYFLYCSLSMRMQILYNLVSLGVDAVLIVYTYAFYSAYLRLISFTSFVNDERKDIVSCQYLYKRIVDMVESVKKSFDFLLITTLVTTTVSVTATLYFPFAEELIKNHGPLKLCLLYADDVQDLLMLFSPALTAGLLARQVEKLKLVLYDKLLEDATHTTDLERFVSYIDARPLRFRVWRVVPLDWWLPVIVINITFTYVIVLVQFTHKY